MLIWFNITSNPALQNMVITVPFSHLGNGVGDLGYLGLGVGARIRDLGCFGGIWDIFTVIFGIFEKFGLFC